MAAKVEISMKDGAVTLRAAVQNVTDALDTIGVAVSSSAQAAFTDQALGDIKWAVRYPKMPDPFINVAGAVSDLLRSARVKGRRFERRPAGVDSNTLSRSISHEVVSDDTVEIGSDVEYAPTFQLGGVSNLPVSEGVKENLRDFLRTGKGKPYRQRLGFLFQLDQLETELVPRPFLGITEQTRRDIIELIEDQIEMEAQGGNA